MPTPKTPKWLSVLASLTLSMSLWPSIAIAQEEPMVATKLKQMTSALTRNDLELYVELAFNEQITVPQAQLFYAGLTKEQKAMVSDLVGIRAGIPLDEWRRDIESHRLQSSSPYPNAATLATSGEVWRQYIENKWLWLPPPGATYASYYYGDHYCEGGANPDPDSDWVFYYPMYSGNPDGLRWTTTSTQVYLVFMTAYGGNLNGFARSWYHAQLCLGAISVAAAGGQEHVKTSVYLSPDH